MTQNQAADATATPKEWIGSATITKTDSDGRNYAWLVQYSFDYEGESGATAKLTFRAGAEWLNEHDVPTPSAPSAWQHETPDQWKIDLWIDTESEVSWS